MFQEEMFKEANHFLNVKQQSVNEKQNKTLEEDKQKDVGSISRS